MSDLAVFVETPRPSGLPPERRWSHADPAAAGTARRRVPRAASGQSIGRRRGRSSRFPPAHSVRRRRPALDRLRHRGDGRAGRRHRARARLPRRPVHLLRLGRARRRHGAPGGPPRDRRRRQPSEHPHHRRGRPDTRCRSGRRLHAPGPVPGWSASTTGLGARSPRGPDARPLHRRTGGDRRGRRGRRHAPRPVRADRARTPAAADPARLREHVPYAATQARASQARRGHSGARFRHRRDRRRDRAAARLHRASQRRRRRGRRTGGQAPRRGFHPRQELRRKTPSRQTGAAGSACSGVRSATAPFPAPSRYPTPRSHGAGRDHGLLEGPPPPPPPQGPSALELAAAAAAAARRQGRGLAYVHAEPTPAPPAGPPRDPDYGAAQARLRPPRRPHPGAHGGPLHTGRPGDGHQQPDRRPGHGP